MRSVAKGNYIKGVGGIRHALAHVRYLQMRGGDDRDHVLGGKRLFINANREAISGSEVNERIKLMDENKVVIHRIVLSPGVEGVDMIAYTRAVMTELERSKGLDIEYYATAHKNTDHDHNHVVLLGRDQHGRQVTLNRSNYKTIREAGDRYLERHHKYDRYLDKELDTIMRDGYKRDRGDRHFEWLLEDLKSNLTLDECDEQRRNPPPTFIKEFAIYALPESERIVRDNVVYTKYSSMQELLKLDERLTTGQVQKVPKDQYQKLWTWIGNKKQFGDDYYERTAEADRVFQQFDEDLKRSLSNDNSPPKSFRQYIFESRGRLLDSHEKYTIDTQRLQLQKHLQALDESGNTDPQHRQGLIGQLEWLDAMSEERIESRRPISIVRSSKEDEKTMHESFAKDRNLSNSEERDRWGNELVERAWKKLLGDQPEDYDKFSPQGKKATQEALGREIAKITAEDHQHQKQESNYQHAKSSEEQEAGLKVAEDAAKNYENELSIRAWINVAKHKVFNDYELKPEIRKHESEILSKEMDKVREEDRNSEPSLEAANREIDEDYKAEAYEVSVAERAYDRAFGDRPWDFDKLSPEFKARAIEDWQNEILKLRADDEHSRNQLATEQLKQSEQKDRNEYEPSDSSDRQIDVDQGQTYSDISLIIFGSEPSVTLSHHDKPSIDHQIDLWQKIAFDADQNRNLSEKNHSTDPIADGIEREFETNISQSQQHQSLDQIMSHQVHNNMHQQIHQTFVENQSHHYPQATPLNKQNIEPEQDRDDDGKEHIR